MLLQLTVRRLGKSSIALGVRGTTEDQEHVRATLTVVHASIDGPRAVPIDDGLRAAMAHFLET